MEHDRPQPLVPLSGAGSGTAPRLRAATRPAGVTFVGGFGLAVGVLVMGLGIGLVFPEPTTGALLLGFGAIQASLASGTLAGKAWARNWQLVLLPAAMVVNFVRLPSNPLAFATAAALAGLMLACLLGASAAAWFRRPSAS